MSNAIETQSHFGKAAGAVRDGAADFFIVREDERGRMAGMRSMTGFGRGEASADGLRAVVELSSVNRKQTDIDVRLPREWAVLEDGIRRRLGGEISRGRVQVMVRVEPVGGQQQVLVVNEGLAREYVAGLRRLQGLLGGPEPEISAELLLRAPGVFTPAGMGELPPDRVGPVLDGALEGAVAAWRASREREGAALQADLLGKLGGLREVVAAIRVEAPRVTVQIREALRRRLEEAGVPLPLDDERLVREIALFADRADISEELSRLESHMEEFERLSKGVEPAGRPLDFLCQEMHREVNTTGAKANSAAIAHLVVAAKTGVERLREQVQNVE